MLVGLTFEETAWYLSHTHRILGRRRQSSDRLRYLELHEKHEKASVRPAAQ